MMTLALPPSQLKYCIYIYSLSHPSYCYFSNVILLPWHKKLHSFHIVSCSDRNPMGHTYLAPMCSIRQFPNEIFNYTTPSSSCGPESRAMPLPYCFDSYFGGNRNLGANQNIYREKPTTPNANRRGNARTCKTKLFPFVTAYWLNQIRK